MMRISLKDGLHMWLMRVPLPMVRECLRLADAGGVRIEPMELASHYLAGGDPHVATRALVKANQVGVTATWRHVAAFDLADLDPVAAVDYWLQHGGPYLDDQLDERVRRNREVAQA